MVSPRSIDAAVDMALVIRSARVKKRIAKAAQPFQDKGSKAKIPSMARPIATTRKKRRIPQLSFEKRNAYFHVALNKPCSCRRSENLGRCFWTPAK